MSAKQASAECPSDPGSTGLKWAAEEQHWVPLFTIPEVPEMNFSGVLAILVPDCANACVVNIAGSVTWHAALNL